MHPMFITALFTIAKACKQPKCPLMHKWNKKICSLSFSLSLSLSLAFVTKWMKPEGIILREINQKEKDKYSMFSLINTI